MISNNDDSDIAEDEDEVQKFSDLLLINSKEEEMTCEKTLKTDENQKKIEEGEKKREETDDVKAKNFDENLNKSDNSDAKSTMMSSTTTILEKKKCNTFENLGNKKDREVKSVVPVENAKKDHRNEIKEKLKNRFLTFANGNKVLKNIFGNNPANNKNEAVINVKNEINLLKEESKIINENEFDFLNFYENEERNFGGDM